LRKVGKYHYCDEHKNWFKERNDKVIMVLIFYRDLC
jgi:hypothetical protein